MPRAGSTAQRPGAPNNSSAVVRWPGQSPSGQARPGRARPARQSPPRHSPCPNTALHHCPASTTLPEGRPRAPAAPGPQANTTPQNKKEKMKHFHNRKKKVCASSNFPFFRRRPWPRGSPCRAGPCRARGGRGRGSPAARPPWPACSLHALVNTHFASNMAECTWDKNKALFPRVRPQPAPEPPSAPASSPVSFLSHIMHVLTGARASRKARNRTQPSTSVLLPRHVAADDDHDSANPAPLSSLTSLIHYLHFIHPHNAAINYHNINF